jgi:Uma2 family endonuclease
MVDAPDRSQSRGYNERRHMPVAVTRRRFTADDYQRMGRAGILSKDDRVELIDGEIVAMTPIGPRHNAAVNRATRAMVLAVGNRAIVQVQGSVRLDLYHEPQPDLVLLRPRADDYASQLPGPSDILLIVEVADSSSDYDREVKSRVYAKAGIGEYWLADLTENAVFVFSAPQSDTYQDSARYQHGQSIAPHALPDSIVAVEMLLAG